MKNKSYLIHKMFARTSLRLSALLLAATVLVGLLPPTAYAQSTTPITITPLMVIPGGYVMVQINHLPADETFTVTMGPAGSQGVNGYVVSHISTDGSVSSVYQFEIHALVRDNKSIDLRIQNSAGLAAYVNFSNARRLPQQATGTPSSSTSSQASSGSGTTTKKGPSIIQVLHVDENRTVQAALYNLPVDTEFTASIGPVGTRGKEKYVIAHITTPHSFDGTNVSTFEIPKNLVGEATLVLYVEAPGYRYVTSFSNTDF